MAFDTLPEMSPEQAYARRIAARELAKYCEEFALWRKTKRGIAAVESLPTRQILLPQLMPEPHPPELDSAT